MPVVKILKPTDYTPSAEDSPRCYGQLRYRSEETIDEEGVKRFGKMVLHFPVGAQPDLKEDVARRLIDSQAAEPAAEPPPVFTTAAELMQRIKS